MQDSPQPQRSNLDQKIAQAKKLLLRVYENYEHPVVMSSFGKDSMVMLDLIKQTGHRLPLIWHREFAGLPKKHAFAYDIIQREGYTVHEYMPTRTAVAKAQGDVDIVSYYQIGPNQTDPPHMWIPAGIERPKAGAPLQCALHDFYQRPTGSCSYWWDCTLVGHKDADENKWLGKVPLIDDIVRIAAGTALAFPLRHFTDSEVWEYIDRFDVPYNVKRYIEQDLDYDSDHYQACTRCLDRDEPQMVHCPKLDRMVPNLSGIVRTIELKKPHYMA